MQNFVRPLFRRLVCLNVFDLASGLLIAGLLVIALMTFRDYGISNDEEVQHRYGELIVVYYSSGFSDQTLFHFKNLYLYGGLFDILAVLLARLLPFDLYLVRHLLSALIGVGGVAATAATARLIAGPRAGFIAAAWLAVCGVWVGEMFNHTKDIPFAAAMMTATYLLCRTARALPRPRWRDVVGFGLLLGVALGLRALALLMIGYTFVAIALHIPWQVGPREGLRLFERSALRFVPAFAIAYAVMILAWPWASLSLLNPLKAIFAFAHFHYQIRTILAGQIYDMANVPWWYVPSYLAIKLPLLLLFGAFCAIVFAAWPRRTSQRDSLFRRETAFIVLIVLFPVICEAVAEGPAFDGLRHFTFVVPPLAVLSGVGFEALLSLLPSRVAWRQSAMFSALAIALLWQAGVLVRLHPYENLFYNSLVGGIEGASRLYVMDYWVNIMPEAVGALENYLTLSSKRDDPRTYTVGVCGETFSFENYADKRLKITGGWPYADFYIAPTHMNCDQAADGKVIVSIERFGVPIGVVKDRRAFIAQPSQAQRR